MRQLDGNLKLDLIEKSKFEPTQPAESPRRSRSRPRSFTLTQGSGNEAPVKRHRIASFHRSRSRTRSEAGSLAGTGGLETAMRSTSSLHGRLCQSPATYIPYLQHQPQDVEVGKIQKLKQMLRNETVEWVDGFIVDGGMDEILALLYRILDLEWREEHEDTLLHETLACVKALSTTSLALQNLESVHVILFPRLLALLFSEAKKGPSEFTTRGLIINLLMTYLSTAAQPDPTARAQTVLKYLRDPAKDGEKAAYGFIATMHHPRPYRVWCKEITNVTKEVFWIFLHQTNVIPWSNQNASENSDYRFRHFPQPHPPKPAAPYVGGVEWDATTYLTAHLDLLNAIIAYLPTREQRCALRQELRDSGFEKVAGGSLRTCKEKFYSHIHEALSTWVEAAQEDDWDVRSIREGVLPVTAPNSPTKSPVKRTSSKPPLAPQLELPKLDFAPVDSWIA